MSYNITLVEPDTKEPIIFDEPHQIAGGTFAVDILTGKPSNTEAWLNVTYNYSGQYGPIWNMTLHDMDGWTVAKAKPYIEEAVKILGTNRSSDYWENTPGNAGAAMADLLILMVRCPDAVMMVS